MKHEVIELDNGFRVGVTTTGDPDRPPLVFLHGLTLDSRAYAELLALLAQFYYVIGVDAPGHGSTDLLRWGHTVKHMAAVVARTLEHLKVQTPTILVGHSMGGGIAVELGADFPEKVGAVVLLDAAAGNPHHERINGGVGPLLAAKLLAGAARDVLGDALHAAKLRGPGEWFKLAGRLAGSFSRMGWLRAGMALWHANTADALVTLAALDVPVVVFHGELDEIVPVEAGRDAAEVSEGAFEEIPGAYHSWMISDPAMAAILIHLAVRDFVETATV